MEKYDLHLHSRFSDGEYTVEEIVQKLKQTEIKIFSITDHDNIDSIKEVEKLELGDLTYIPGVEISAQKDEYKIHILGYNINPDNKGLIEMLKDMKARKNLRNLEIIEQLKTKFGIEITKEEALEIINAKSFVGQTTIAELLYKKGIIPNAQCAFDNYFKKMDLKTPATIDLNRAVEVIHGAGGYAIIAHPIKMEKRYNINIEEEISMFKEAKIDGLEVFNSCHTLSDIKRYYGLAVKEGLLISGGSDFHGEILKPNVKLGKVSKDGAKVEEHYNRTVISKCLRDKQLSKKIEEDKEERV